MAHSKRFYGLCIRLAELRRHMLPEFSPTGAYNPEDEDRARGYRLLVHAEIESYLEDQAIQVIKDKIDAWRINRTPSNLILSFLACYHSGWVESDDDNNLRIIELSKSRKRIKEVISEIIDQAQAQFIQILRNNHGVREKNLKKLILPTGVELSDLDPSWIADLDDFGKQRGEIAHKANMTTGAINPEDEYKRVKNLLIGLIQLDTKLTQIL